MFSVSQTCFCTSWRMGTGAGWSAMLLLNSWHTEVVLASHTGYCDPHHSYTMHTQCWYALTAHTGLVNTKTGSGFPIYSVTKYAVAGYTKAASQVGGACWSTHHTHITLHSILLTGYPQNDLCILRPVQVWADETNIHLVTLWVFPASLTHLFFLQTRRDCCRSVRAVYRQQQGRGYHGVPTCTSPWAGLPTGTC